MNIELMQKVRASVLAEPQLVDMNDWARTIYMPGRGFTLMGQNMDTCGTVCCIAGWAVLLSGADPKGLHGMEGRHAVLAASVLLGLQEAEARLLFFFMDADERIEDPYYRLAVKLTLFEPGTKGYAAVVAEAIDLCIERNHDPQPEPEPEPDPIVVETGDDARAHALGVLI